MPPPTKSKRTVDPTSNGHRSDGRVPPHNVGAEASLLGAALLDRAAVHILIATTTADDFYRPAHQHIAHAIRSVHAAGVGVDSITVADELRRAGLLEDIGPGYLAELQNATPAVSAAAHYAGIVRDTSVSRQLIAGGAAIVDLGYTATLDPAVAVLEARQILTDLTDTARPSLRARTMSVAELDNLPPLDPIVDQLIDFDTVVLAYGRRGCGKSFVAVDLTASIASGSRWHGRMVQHAPVLYVVAEGAAGLGRRYDAWVGLDRNANSVIDDAQLRILPEPVNLLNPAAVGEFAGMAADLGARLIVLDTLARCMVGGDENSARDAGIAIEQLDVIRRRTGACVVAVHHSGKSLDAGARGSSAFEAAADTVLEIGMTDDIMTITATKQKNHVTPNPIRLRLRPAGTSAVLDDYRADVDEVSPGTLETLAALRDIEVEGGATASQWALSSPRKDATFYRDRSRLVTLGLVENIGSPKQPRYQVSNTGAITLSQDSYDPF